MKSRFTKIIAISSFIWTATFIAFAFVVNSIVPLHWGAMGRLGYIVVNLLVHIIVFGALIDNNKL